MEGLDGVFGVWHEREDASCGIADACDVVCRAVGVVRVSQEDLLVLFEGFEDVWRCVVFAFAVCDGDTESFLFCGFIGILELEILPIADELSRCVFCECSGEEFGFG